MRLRIIVRMEDPACVVHGGASAAVTEFYTFDVDAPPELAEWWARPKNTYEERVFVGIEVLAAQREETK